jgi:hypothetical protein
MHFLAKFLELRHRDVVAFTLCETASPWQGDACWFATNSHITRTTTFQSVDTASMCEKPLFSGLFIHFSVHRHIKEIGYG